MTLPVCVGLGWRPETAWLLDGRPRAAFSEVIAENVDPERPPRALAAAIERGLVVVTHGVGLSLGSAERPERARVRRLARVAARLRSPLVSEHVAFARAGGLEAPHFLPVAHTRAQLAILVDNVRAVADALPVPLALENVAAPLAWPGAELAEADFLAELVERTGVSLLLDVANLLANLRNHGGDPDRVLGRLPLDRVAYLHVAGGARPLALWRDTHAHPIEPDLLDLLGRVLARTGQRPVLLERDHAFGARADLECELDALERVLAAAPVGPVRGAGTSRTEIPTAERTTRRSVAAAQRALLADLTAPSPVTPPGFSPVHLAEVRAIFDAKTARRHSHGRMPAVGA